MEAVEFDFAPLLHTNTSGDSLSMTNAVPSPGVDWVVANYDIKTAEIPTVDGEVKRLRALKAYNFLLDKEPQACYDHFADLARQLFDTSMAFICLVDLGRVWTISARGVPNGAPQENPRRVAICSHTLIARKGFLVTPDAGEDSRFERCPTVNVAGIRFFAGVPLYAPDGSKIGTMSVGHHEPRHTWTERHTTLLKNIAASVMDLMEEQARHVSAERAKNGIRNQRRDSESKSYLSEEGHNHTQREPKVRAVNITSFLLSLKAALGAFPKTPSSKFLIDTSVPSSAIFEELEVFRCAIALIWRSYERSSRGLVQLRMFVSEVNGTKDLVFETHSDLVSQNKQPTTPKIRVGAGRSHVPPSRGCLHWDESSGKYVQECSTSDHDVGGDAVASYIGSTPGGKFGVGSFLETDGTSHATTKHDANGSMAWFSIPLILPTGSTG